jgi:hypothetical protein
LSRYGRVAQLVEQRTENPRVGSSILPPATIFNLMNPLGVHQIEYRGAAGELNSVQHSTRDCPFASEWAFARFNDTLSVIEKASELTYPRPIFLFVVPFSLDWERKSV